MLACWFTNNTKTYNRSFAYSRIDCKIPLQRIQWYPVQQEQRKEQGIPVLFSHKLQKIVRSNNQRIIFIANRKSTT
jgi:hypothetical protein